MDQNGQTKLLEASTTLAAPRRVHHPRTTPEFRPIREKMALKSDPTLHHRHAIDTGRSYKSALVLLAPYRSVPDSIAHRLTKNVARWPTGRIKYQSSVNDAHGAKTDADKPFLTSRFVHPNERDIVKSWVSGVSLGGGFGLFESVDEWNSLDDIG